MSEQPIFGMNPYVDIHIDPPPETIPIDSSRVETITTRCPVRGRGLIIRDLTHATDPELFAFFLEVVARGGELDLDSDSPLVEPLAHIGFLVVDDDIIEWPRFAIPLELAADTDATGDGWIVADTFLFQPEFALHPAIPWPVDYDEQEGRLHSFAPGPAFWVGDPAALVTPRWVAPEAAALLAGFVPGAPPPPLPPAFASPLVAVGALVRRGAAPAAPLARFADCRVAFASERHVVVRDLLSSGELAALRRYYAALLTDGLVQFSDGQCAARFSTYNDPVGRFVHARLAAAMSAVTGQPVAPSFSYFFSYVDGASSSRIRTARRPSSASRSRSIIRPRLPPRQAGRSASRSTTAAPSRPSFASATPSFTTAASSPIFAARCRPGTSRATSCSSTCRAIFAAS